MLSAYERGEISFDNDTPILWKRPLAISFQRRAKLKKEFGKKILPLFKCDEICDFSYSGNTKEVFKNVRRGIWHQSH